MLARTGRASRGTSTPFADNHRAGGDEAPQQQHKMHPETPPPFLKGGRKKKREPQGVRLSKKSLHEEKSLTQ